MHKKFKEKLGLMGFHRRRFPTGKPEDKRFVYFWCKDKIPYASQMSEKDLNELINFSIA